MAKRHFDPALKIPKDFIRKLGHSFGKMRFRPFIADFAAMHEQLTAYRRLPTAH